MFKRIDEEFEELFLHCQKLTNSNKKEMENLLKPLRNHLLKEQLKKYFLIAFIFGAICCGIYYVDTLNWYFCALGRLLMIKLLPFWDWTRLAEARCLIGKAEVRTRSSGGFSRLNDEKDCRACEHFGEKFKALE